MFMQGKALHYTVRPAVPQILGSHKQIFSEEYEGVADASFGFTSSSSPPDRF